MAKRLFYPRIVVNKSQSEIPLKRIVELRDWNRSRGLAKPKSNDLKLLNNYLEEVRAQLTDCYRQFNQHFNQLKLAIAVSGKPLQHSIFILANLFDISV